MGVLRGRICCCNPRQYEDHRDSRRCMRTAIERGVCRIWAIPWVCYRPGTSAFTKGQAGMPPTECGPLRRTEATASAAVVGVNTVEFLEHPDGAIENGPRLRADVRAAVEAHAPDTVLITNHHGTWPSGDPNSQDHQSVGTAVIDALTPEAVADQRVKRVLVAGSPTPTHVLDVTSTVDVASDSLACHRAYLTALGHHPMAAPGYLPRGARSYGSVAPRKRSSHSVRSDRSMTRAYDARAAAQHRPSTSSCRTVGTREGSHDS